MQFIKDDMVVGIGTGSTARFFIAALGKAVREHKLRKIRGIPTSMESEWLAKQAGIDITSFTQVSKVDITVDGADEIAPDLSLVKGLGGALLREKLVAQNSKRLVIIADSSKEVFKLGTRVPLPVEVVQFGHEASKRFLESLGSSPALRHKPDGSPFITDNGNYIYDCRFRGIDKPAELNAVLAARSGIVESGLFMGLAEMAIIAEDDGVKTLTAPVRSQ